MSLLSIPPYRLPYCEMLPSVCHDGLMISECTVIKKSNLVEMTPRFLPEKEEVNVTHLVEISDQHGKS